MMTDSLFHDYETRSAQDLKVNGLDRYSKCMSTEVLMLNWAVNDSPVKAWYPHEGKMPAELREALTDPSVTKRAWNAQFERQITKHVLGIDVPQEQYRCTMVLAHTMSLPGSLDEAGKVLRLPEHLMKMAEGKRLIRKFSQPRKPTKDKPWIWCDWDTDPEDWDLFCQYGARDVEAERAAFKKMAQYDMPPEEWALWFLDQKINERGLPMDRLLVTNAARMAKDEKARLKLRLKMLTGLDNPMSAEQFLVWVRSQGYPFNDVRKSNLQRAVDETLPFAKDVSTKGHQAIEMRMRANKTSVQKYDAILRTIGEDDRLRFSYQFAGAGRTWRWAGRVWQQHNLPRPHKSVEPTIEIATELLRQGDENEVRLYYPEPMEVLSSCIRSGIRAPKGKKLVVADLNAIENRSLGYMARSDTILNVFRERKCPYLAFAVDLFSKPYESMTKKSPERTMAKPAVLGAGYRLGGGQEAPNKKGDIIKTGLWGYADSMGIKITQEFAKQSVDVWRQKNPEVTELWKQYERAFKRVMQTQETIEVEGGFRLFIQGPTLRVRLPSGRCLTYLRPQMKVLEFEGVDGPYTRETITYEGLNAAKKWSRITTHGRKLVENWDQAISRDVLAPALLEAERMGFEVIGHVHDELIAMVDEDSPLGIKDLLGCLTINPRWAGDWLPLEAAGYESEFYKKD